MCSAQLFTKSPGSSAEAVTLSAWEWFGQQDFQRSATGLQLLQSWEPGASEWALRSASDAALRCTLPPWDHEEGLKIRSVSISVNGEASLGSCTGNELKNQSPPQSLHTQCHRQLPILPPQHQTGRCQSLWPQPPVSPPAAVFLNPVHYSSQESSEIPFRLYSDHQLKAEQWHVTGTGSPCP